MNSGVPLSDLKNKLLSGFKTLETNMNGAAKEEAFALRRQGIDAFDRLGFPTVKNEEWKYTNVSRFIDEDWGHEIGNQLHTYSVFNGLEKTLSAFPDAHRHVFVDGVFNPELSEIKPGDETISLISLAKALKFKPDQVASYMGKSFPTDTNGFTALNTAFAADGSVIIVPKSIKPKYPVHLVFVSGSGAEKTINHIRNLIVLEAGASLDLIETWVSSGNSPYLSNAVTEVFVGENAVFNHYRFQQENTDTARQVNFTRVVQQKDSLANNFTVTTGGKLVRNDLQIMLDGPHCESHLYGLYISSAAQHIDNHTLVDHAQPQSFSNEAYKGIMADQSTGVFNGKVMVRKDAQKTNAYQSNKNILLSDDAKINTKPQLEIFANDVKCSHGATTGQLDEEALFYLRSRGIGENEAKAMLTTAFAAEAIENIKSGDIKSYAMALVKTKLSPLGKA